MEVFKMSNDKRISITETGSFKYFDKDSMLSKKVYELVTEGKEISVPTIISLDTIKKYRFLQTAAVMSFIDSPACAVVILDKPSFKLTVALPAFSAVSHGRIRTFVNMSNYAAIRAEGGSEHGYAVEDRKMFSLLSAGAIEEMWNVRQLAMKKWSTTQLALFASVYVDAMMKIFNRRYSVGTNQSSVDKIRYFCAKFAICTMLNIDEELGREVATKVANIGPAVVDVIDDNHYTFQTVFTLLDFIAYNIRGIDLVPSAFVETWLKTYGQSTAFAIDYVPAFMTMLSDAHIGAYMNNQKSIESLLVTGGNKLLQLYLGI